MKICAIICEYNPLHNGHALHIKRSRELCSADGVIALMSGNFVQRGEPAIMDKFVRARAAIAAGADMVLELPSIYAVASAENFATGAIRILSQIEGVDTLSFGSEFGDVNLLSQLADFFINPPQNFKNSLSNHLSTGKSLARARGEATMDCLASGCLQLENTKQALAAISSPNSILAIEYIKAIKRQNSAITPITITRLGGGYNDSDISSSYPSASAIRKLLHCDNIDSIKSFVPPYVFEQFESCEMLTNAAQDKLSDLVLYSLRTLTPTQMSQCYEMGEGLENRIKKYAHLPALNDVLFAVKTKRYTLAKLRRIMICLLLGITTEAVTLAGNCPPYTKLLAIKKGRTDLIAAATSKDLRLLTRADDYTKVNNIQNVVDIDIRATDIYALLHCQNTNRIGGKDLSTPLQII